MDITLADLEALISARTADAVKAALEALPPVRGGAAGAQSDDAALKTAFHDWTHRKAVTGLKAAMAEGSASTGGVLVPQVTANEIIIPLQEMSYLRRAGARIVTVTGTNSFKVPRLTNSAAATLTSEGASISGSEPTTDVVTFAPYKYSKLAKASIELVNDSQFDIWGNILRPDWQNAWALAENSAFTTGTGSSQPEGFAGFATVGVTLATGQTTTISSADSIIDLFYSLDYKYRANATWMMNDATLKIIRKLKDSQNQYIWQAGLGNMPETILGRPIVTNNSMATPAANAITVVFGDFSYYWIADFVGGSIEVQILNELYAASGQVGYVGHRRLDGHPMLSSAFTALKQSAT